MGYCELEWANIDTDMYHSTVNDTVGQTTGGDFRGVDLRHTTAVKRTRHNES